MNCDQVFNILTRGPFPSGDSTDAAVEIHLSLCAECRHFADALRPDGAQDSEALVPEESRGLPYYWGVAASPEEPARLARSEQTSALTATEDRRRPRRRRKPSFFERHEPLAQLSGWQLAFAVLMGALLGTLLRLVGYADFGSSTPPDSASVNTVDAGMNNLSGRRSPASLTEIRLAEKLGSTPECCKQELMDYQPYNGQPHEGHEGYPSQYGYGSAEDNRAACCTKCHNASSPRFALRGTTPKLIRSCQVCHEESSLRGGYQFGGSSHR